MIVQTKKQFYRITLILYTILSIASTVYLIFRPEDEQIQERFHDTQREIERIQEYLEGQDSDYQQTIEALKQQNDSLSQELELNQMKLSHARSQVKIRFADLITYVDRYDWDTLLEKNEVAFDSLSQMSLAVIHDSKVRDSLCDQQIHVLEQTVALKDSIIISGQSLLGDYKSAHEQLFNVSSDLNAELLQRDKKLQRKNRLCRVLSGVFVTGAGIVTAHFLINH